MTGAVVVEPSASAETAELLAQIDRTRLPVHVAAIMDGNGRWAAGRGLERSVGHSEGVEAVRDTVEAASALGLRALTLFAFSMENWSRPPDEVAILMGLLKKYLRTELDRMVANDIRFRPVGRLDGLPPDVREMVDIAVGATAACRGLDFQIAVNYGGRAEIVDAARAFAARAVELGRVPELDEPEFASLLYGADVPDPDLLIRTSGEMRVSNFLLYQIAYTELWVTPTLWPDFRRRHLYEAILDFQGRTRRYGGL